MKHIRKNTLVVKKVSEGVVQDDYSILAGAHLTVVYIVLGSQDLELSPSVHLVGMGSSATVIGLISGSGDAKLNVHTLQHHQAVNTTSNLLVKSVLSGRSICSYEGSILVDKKAQKTDAYQRNENLLLDEHSRATSSPALEILANDVRCTHGAVVKTLDEQELWYLSTRGIDTKRAREMISEGFLASALSLISDDKERSEVERQIVSL